MVATRSSTKATDAELANGSPVFPDQIIEAVRVEQNLESGRSAEILVVAGGGTTSLIGQTATLHGRTLLNLEFTLERPPFVDLIGYDAADADFIGGIISLHDQLCLEHGDAHSLLTRPATLVQISAPKKNVKRRQRA